MSLPIDYCIPTYSSPVSSNAGLSRVSAFAPASPAHSASTPQSADRGPSDSILQSANYIMIDLDRLHINQSLILDYIDPEAY